jgi:hypothetical protein
MIINILEEVSPEGSCTVDWHPCDWLQLTDKDDTCADMSIILSPMHPQTFHIPLDKAVLSFETVSVSSEPVVPRITMAEMLTKSMELISLPIDQLSKPMELVASPIDKLRKRTTPSALATVPIKKIRKHRRPIMKESSHYKFMALSKVQHMVWFYNHVNPSPSLVEKKSLSTLLGLREMQIHNWFKDCRRRGLPRRFVVLPTEDE